jgi:hypothetical protein
MAHQGRHSGSVKTSHHFTDTKPHPFKCPVAAQEGKTVECKGGTHLDGLLGMNFYVKGIDDKIPGSKARCRDVGAPMFQNSRRRGTRTLSSLTLSRFSPGPERFPFRWNRKSLRLDSACRPGHRPWLGGVLVAPVWPAPTLGAPNVYCAKTGAEPPSMTPVASTTAMRALFIFNLLLCGVGWAGSLPAPMTAQLGARAEISSGN